MLVKLPGWSDTKSGFCLPWIQNSTLYLHRRGAEDAEIIVSVVIASEAKQSHARCESKSKMISASLSVASGVLPFVLRAALHVFKIVPDDFVSQ